MPTDAYIQAADARTLGASYAAAIAGISTLLAKSDADLDAHLLAASMDIDSAMPYQGCKFDPDQVREFPRYIGIPWVFPGTFPGAVQGAGVWDWNDATNAAVVPGAVKLACLFQAVHLLDPTHAARLDAIRSGLAAQSAGSLSETYLKPGDLPGGLSGLCARAQRIMERYRLRSGAML